MLDCSLLFGGGGRGARNRKKWGWEVFWKWEEKSAEWDTQGGRGRELGEIHPGKYFAIEKVHNGWGGKWGIEKWDVRAPCPLHPPPYPRWYKLSNIEWYEIVGPSVYVHALDIMICHLIHLCFQIVLSSLSSVAERTFHNLRDIFPALDWRVFVWAIQASNLCFPIRIVKECNRSSWGVPLEFFFWDNDSVNLYKDKISGSHLLDGSWFSRHKIESA